MYDEESDARDLIQRMREYIRRIDEVDEMIRDRRSLPAFEKQRAREAFKSLRDDLSDEARHLGKTSTQAEMSPIQHAFYAPAIMKASGNFIARTNENPTGGTWASTLYTIRMDIDYLLRQLVEKFPESA